MKVDGDRLWGPSGYYFVITVFFFLFALSFSRTANVPRSSAADPDFAICSAFPNCRFTFSIGKCYGFLGGKSASEIIQPLSSGPSSVCLTVHTLVTGTVVWHECAWLNRTHHQAERPPSRLLLEARKSALCSAAERKGTSAVRNRRPNVGGCDWRLRVQAVMVELFHWCKRVVMFFGIMGPICLHKHKYTCVFYSGITKNDCLLLLFQ